MTDLVTEYSEYDSFVRAWHADDLDPEHVTLEAARTEGRITEDETRMVWQLLAELDAEELLIQLPEWLADEKTGVVDGATPTLFIGQIDRETEKAIRFTDAVAAQPLLKLAQRIHYLEHGLEDLDPDEDERRESLEQRLETRRREFSNREDLPGLRDEWLPKSQLIHAVRRNN